MCVCMCVFSLRLCKVSQTENWDFGKYFFHNQNTLLGLHMEITDDETVEGYRTKTEKEREDEWKRMILHEQFLRTLKTFQIACHEQSFGGDILRYKLKV